MLDDREISSVKYSDIVDLFNRKQFESIIEFVNNLPRLKKEVEYKCEECNTINKTTLEGLQDFLS